MHRSMKSICTRRRFLQATFSTAAALPLTNALSSFAQTSSSPAGKVAVVRCTKYGADVSKALGQAFDLIGGIGSLVKDKTVTIKVNLTGTDFTNFMNRPVGETYMTHYDTAAALTSALFAAGAKRVRFVESTQSRAGLESSLGFADWDVNA